MSLDCEEINANIQIALQEEKDRTLATMRKLSLLYTSSDESVGTTTLTKYFLRGVSTRKDITYICRRAEPDLIEMDLDSDAPKDHGDQWWKCAYVVEDDSAKVVVEVSQVIPHAGSC